MSDRETEEDFPRDPTILDTLDQIADFAHAAGVERVDLHLDDTAIGELHLRLSEGTALPSFMPLKGGAATEDDHVGVFRGRLHIYRASISPFEAAERLASMLKHALPDASVRRLTADGGCAEAIVVEVANKSTGQSVCRITTIATVAHVRTFETLGTFGHSVVEPRSWTHGAVRKEFDRILEDLSVVEPRSWTHGAVRKEFDRILEDLGWGSVRRGPGGE